MTPGVFNQRGIFLDLATDQRAQACHDIAAQPAAAHHHAKDLPQAFHRAMPGNVFGSSDDHLLSPPCHFGPAD